MAESDYFNTNRRLLESDLWLSEPFTRGQAWVDLIGKSNWRNGYVRIRGRRIALARGQLAASEVWLSKRWKWSRNKVRRFLNELETEQQIGQQKTNVCTLITVVNYDRYQSHDTANDTAGGQRKDSKRYSGRTAERQRKDTEEEETITSNKGEEGKEGKESSSVTGVTNASKPVSKTPQKSSGPRNYPAEFEALWRSYPARNGRRAGKSKAYAEWKRIPDSDQADLTLAVRTYADHCRSTDTIPRDFERFVKADWWRDWLAPAEPVPKTGTCQIPTDEELANYRPTTTGAAP